MAYWKVRLKNVDRHRPKLVPNVRVRFRPPLSSDETLPLKEGCEEARRSFTMNLYMRVKDSSEHPCHSHGVTLYIFNWPWEKMPSRPLQSRIFNLKGCQGSGKGFRTACSTSRVVKVLGQGSEQNNQPLEYSRKCMEKGFGTAYSTSGLSRQWWKGSEQHI